MSTSRSGTATGSRMTARPATGRSASRPRWPSSWPGSWRTRRRSAASPHRPSIPTNVSCPASWAPAHVAYAAAIAPRSSASRAHRGGGSSSARAITPPHPYLALDRPPRRRASTASIANSIPAHPPTGDLGHLPRRTLARAGRPPSSRAPRAKPSTRSRPTPIVMAALGPVCGPELLRIKREELARYDRHVSEWERAVYFERLTLNEREGRKRTKNGRDEENGEPLPFYSPPSFFASFAPSRFNSFDRSIVMTEGLREGSRRFRSSITMSISRYKGRHVLAVEDFRQAVHRGGAARQSGREHLETLIGYRGWCANWRRCSAWRADEAAVVAARNAVEAGVPPATGRQRRISARATPTTSSTSATAIDVDEWAALIGRPVHRLLRIETFVEHSYARARRWTMRSNG